MSRKTLIERLRETSDCLQVISPDDADDVMRGVEKIEQLTALLRDIRAEWSGSDKPCKPGACSACDALRARIDAAVGLGEQGA